MILVSVLPVRADFVLIRSEHLDVYEGHMYGVLWDSSSANIFEGLFQGSQFFCYDDSRIEILGGVYVKRVDPWTDNTYFNLYDNGVIDIYGGDFESSSFRLYNNANLNIFGGNFLQGSIDPDNKHEYNCIINISGGIYNWDHIIRVQGGSTLNLYGLDFRSLDFGLTIGSDNRVSGHGRLSCKWFDGSGTVVTLSNTYGVIYLHYEPLTENPYCTASIAGDLDNNCKVDMNDLAILVSNWLKCNIDPQTACWE